jgi:hypothetical protein
MSKRHATSRRKAYGRRQHELHEREERRADRLRLELDWSDELDAPRPDPLAFADSRSPRLRFGFD